MESAEVVVVGLGAVGSAALYRLARLGVRAVGIDRFDPPHDMGSTHGGSRVTRLAVAEGDCYVALARRSHEIWRELEAETGAALLRETGLLVIGEGDGAPSHGTAGFLGATLDVARRHGVAHEVLDSAEIRRRHPQFAVRDGERAFFEPTGGVVFPETAVAVQLRLARQHGAVVRADEAVLAIEPDGAGVVVTTARGRIAAGQVVLTAGAWLPGLAGGVVAERVQVHRQVFHWYRPERPELYAPEACPVFIWLHGAAETDYVYGFPLLPGEPGVKVGTEQYAGHVEPDLVDRVVGVEEVARFHRVHVQGRLLGLGSRLTKASTCLYSVTPDAGFILDRLGGNGAVLAASCCSGHGFKHSPALGEAIAHATVDPSIALAPAFRLSRLVA